MKSVLEEGRRLASSGRMELDVHDALESLDKVVELANQVVFLFFIIACVRLFFYAIVLFL